MKGVMEYMVDRLSRRTSSATRTRASSIRLNHGPRQAGQLRQDTLLVRQRVGLREQACRALPQGGLTGPPSAGINTGRSLAMARMTSCYDASTSVPGAKASSADAVQDRIGEFCRNFTELKWRTSSTSRAAPRFCDHGLYLLRLTYSTARSETRPRSISFLTPWASLTARLTSGHIAV